MSQMKYYGCNSKWREDQGCVRQAQCPAANNSIKIQRWCPIYTGTCILQTDDDGSTSEKQFVPDFIRMTVVISVSPTVSAICTPSNAADRQIHIYVFVVVVLISEGEDEVKKVQFFN